LNIYQEHFNDLTKFVEHEDGVLLSKTGEELATDMMKYFHNGKFIEESYDITLDARYCIDKESHRFHFQLFVEEDGTPTAFYGGYY
jgi:hypothetical protein